LIIPIIKPGQEGSVDVSKFRPISLLDIGGKVLEKIMINRINHHVYSLGYMNENQFGFRPQKSTIDAAMAIKDCQTRTGRRRSNSTSKLGRTRRIRRSLVAGDSEGTKGMQMSQEPIRTHKELLHPTIRGNVHEHLTDRERNKQRLPAGLVLWSKLLELTIQLVTGA
jgi:hypothetical protein